MTAACLLSSPTKDSEDLRALPTRERLHLRNQTLDVLNRGSLFASIRIATGSQRFQFNLCFGRESPTMGWKPRFTEPWMSCGAQKVRKIIETQPFSQVLNFGDLDLVSALF